jgi:hypothetical protein
MPFQKSKYAILLPVIFVSVHILLTVAAEIQYRTGWLYIPPTVSFDPSPLPIAEIVAICISLPAYVFCLAIAVAAFRTVGFAIVGTTLLMLEVPFITGLWWVVGRWFDSRSVRRHSTG